MPKPKKNKKVVQPILRFFCEGAKTEPQYLNSFKNSLESRFLDKVKWENSKKNTPVELVQEVIDAKNKEDGNDIFWVVFDREGVTKYKDCRHQQARDLALSNGVFIAFSNVCFELWILLHFEYSTAQYSNCHDLISNSQLKKHLLELGISDYEKGINIFEQLKSKIGTAERNASRVRKASKSSAETGKDRPYQLNPYTDVDEILKSMRVFVKIENEKLTLHFLEAIKNFIIANPDWNNQLDDFSSNIISHLRKFSQIELYHFLYVLNYDKENVINQDVQNIFQKEWSHSKSWKVYQKILDESLRLIKRKFT